MKIVLKVGGNEIDDPSFLDRVSDLVVGIRRANHEVVMVHGGGKEISGLLSKLGFETKFVGGLRYTDPETLSAVEMVLSGVINKRLVKVLLRKGIDTIGLSGVDGKLLIAERIFREGIDIGLVGEVKEVNVAVLSGMMQKFVVVLSPLATDKECSDTLNVNADYAAAAIGSSVNADLIIFLSNVPGVLNESTVVPQMDETLFRVLVKSGVVSGGMIPKIEAALAASRSGSGKVVVTDVEGAAMLIAGKLAGTLVNG